MKKILIILILFSTKVVATDSENTTKIVVFSQAKKDWLFREKTLPQLRTYCKSNKLDLVELEVATGVPAEITTSPAIILQSPNGRVIYSARYTEFSTIQNFIRTSRFSNQVSVKNCRENLLRFESGRATFLVSLKITQLSGDIPKGFNQTDFNQKAINSVSAGLSSFKFSKQNCLQKTDRVFYVDVHPYKDKSGKVFVSYELFSQFNCIIPVFSKMNEPKTGEFASVEKIFHSIGSEMQNEIFSQLNTSKSGDASYAIDNTVPVKTWESLGLKLPQKSNSKIKNINPNLPIPESWVFAGAKSPDLPIILFHFQEPLDRYAGEVRKMNGNLSFSEKKMGGKFEVETQSLTMGIKDFDEKVHAKYIKAFKFPMAYFSFENVSVPTDLKFGQTNLYEVTGVFQLMKIKKNVTMQTQITPILNQKDEIVLDVSVKFQLNIGDDFGIAGPDGPVNAKKFMTFYGNFMMKTQENKSLTIK